MILYYQQDVRFQASKPGSKSNSIKFNILSSYSTVRYMSAHFRQLVIQKPSNIVKNPTPRMPNSCKTKTQPYYQYIHNTTPPKAYYSRAAPTKVNAMTTAPTKIGALSIGPCSEEEELLCVAVALTDPEPGVAVPVEVPPAFWDPAPVRPAPVPAPVFIRLAAAEGIAGRASFVTFQVEDWAGQVDEPPVELYPPSPVGFAVPAKAVMREAKSASSVTEVSLLMVTRP
jgi:hypothetical protein